MPGEREGIPPRRARLYADVKPAHSKNPLESGFWRHAVEASYFATTRTISSTLFE